MNNFFIRAARKPRPWLWGSILISSLLIIASLVYFLVGRKADNEEEVMTDKKTAFSGEFVGNEVSNASTKDENPVPHPDSIPAMREKNFQGSDLKIDHQISVTEKYSRYHISYLSEGLKISGIMNVPMKGGPFPVLVLNHGYIDPEIYTNGQGLKREQDYFASRGYVVIHSDYRNHAQSDFDPDNDLRPRSGYVEDIMNLLNAIKISDFDFMEKDNIGMLGHSMGGGITLNVMAIAPPEVKAYALLAPISSDYRKNFDRWVAKEWPELAEKIMLQYGSFEESPEFWKSVSAKNYLDKFEAPVILHQGGEDEDVPVSWSRELAELLKENGKEVYYYEYPKEGHQLFSAFNSAMEKTEELFAGKLKNKP